MSGCEFLSVFIPQEQLNNWDFDIFKAESLSNKQPLRYVGQELFSRHDLLRRCNVSSYLYDGVGVGARVDSVHLLLQTSHVFSLRDLSYLITILCLHVHTCTQISSQHLDNFLSKIEAGYGRYGNPYHNATHAADVAITTHYFIHSLGLKVRKKISLKSVQWEN